MCPALVCGAGLKLGSKRLNNLLESPPLFTLVNFIFHFYHYFPFIHEKKFLFFFFFFLIFNF